MKKQTFSLIEVLVCLGLLSLLLSTLFSWYYTLSQQKAEFNTLKAPLMEERYAHQRLQQILPTVNTPFFSTEDGLVFIFDRGLCVIPELSGKVLGRLYHDPLTHRLCLGIWPYPTHHEVLQEPSQTLILLDGVIGCSFEFYYPPDPFRNKVNPSPIGTSTPLEGWQNQWKKSYNRLPALVKITITREHTFQYVFDLPIPIIYSQELA